MVYVSFKLLWNSAPCARTSNGAAPSAAPTAASQTSATPLVDGAVPVSRTVTVRLSPATQTDEPS